jgi:hypothetical protein
MVFLLSCGFLALRMAAAAGIRNHPAFGEGTAWRLSPLFQVVTLQGACREADGMWIAEGGWLGGGGLSVWRWRNCWGVTVPLLAGKVAGAP